MRINAEFLGALKSRLCTEPAIVITNHINPDGDAMGSSLGLAGVLKGLGHNVKVIVPNGYPAFLHWMPGNEEVIIHEEHKGEAEEYLKNADLIFHLDYNNLQRSGELREGLTHSKAYKVVVDHHQQPDNFPDLILSDPTLSSTCEMIFHLVDQMGWIEQLSTELASCLYTGLITDTGSFRFSATSPETHRVAARLLEKGVESNWVASQVYDNNAPNRYRLLSKTLENMQVLDNLKTTILSLSEESLNQFNYSKGDTEGFVNYGLSISGIIIAVFLIEKDGKVKISFRSKGKFDVNKLARSHFSGGGHTNAAGGIFYGHLEDAIKRMKEILPLYQEELENCEL